MSPEQKLLVRSTWVELVPVADSTAALFYGRLFTIDPAARQLFGSDMKAQGVRFMQMLSVFVRSLDDLGSMADAIESLGRRHGEYGVVPSDFDGVGRALLWAFEQVLGARFTTAVREAWEDAYATLAGMMLRGMAAAV